MWHIVGKEMSNLDMAQLIASVIGKKLRYKLVEFHAPRPGHDMRYALDGTKLAKVGWEPARDIEETVTDTVEWYLNHREWL
jgi:dTDP-glucose 4,6-dehydratase